MANLAEKYPYLSVSDTEEPIENEEELTSLNLIRKKDLKKKIAKCSLTKEVTGNEEPLLSTYKTDLRVVIIGKTGEGKSATANTILGKERFTEDSSQNSVTLVSRCINEMVDERNIFVMDTPGLKDTSRSDETAIREIARMTTVFPDGVHAFIYVMSIGNPRFTDEDKYTLKVLQDIFGKEFFKFCILVYSHGESLKKDLDTYVTSQMKMDSFAGPKIPTNEITYGMFLGKLSSKIVAIDNNATSPMEKKENRVRILKIVDQMRHSNNNDVYMNDMFVDAQKRYKEMKKEGLRKGWDPSTMCIVEQIILAKPTITEQELQNEVKLQLKIIERPNEEERRNDMILMIRNEHESLLRFAIKGVSNKLRIALLVTAGVGAVVVGGVVGGPIGAVAAGVVVAVVARKAYDSLDK